MITKLIISCEHATNALPAEYQSLFNEAKLALESHRGYDLGAIELFDNLVTSLDPNYAAKGKYSRLLVELNRSLHHKNIFSEFTNGLDQHEKKKLIASYYTPYRTNLEGVIRTYIENNYNVLHLSVHSFTPVLNGEKRNAEIGILYNPKKAPEKVFAIKWKEQLKLNLPNYNVRFNYPYLGTADGFTTILRKTFPSNYSGLELEVNNKLATELNWKLIQEKISNGTKNSLRLVNVLKSK
ncbi:MAG: putative N-formylglutamate amidohydrolase [Vicingaceae bacterium]